MICYPVAPRKSINLLLVNFAPFWVGSECASLIRPQHGKPHPSGLRGVAYYVKLQDGNNLSTKDNIPVPNVSIIQSSTVVFIVYSSPLPHLTKKCMNSIR